MAGKIQKLAPFIKVLIPSCLVFWLLGNLLASEFNVSPVEFGKAYSIRMGADVPNDAVWVFKDLDSGFFLDTVSMEALTQTGKISIEITSVLGLGWRVQTYRFARF